MSTLSEMHAKATVMLEMIGEDLTAFGGDVEGHLRVVIAHLEHVVGDAKPSPEPAQIEQLPDGEFVEADPELKEHEGEEMTGIEVPLGETAEVSNERRGPGRPRKQS